MKMTRFNHRPLSYSQYNSFKYYRDDWYDTYILGKKKPPNMAMTCGSVIGDSIGTPQSLVPQLVPPGIKEYRMEANLNEIKLVGFADHYCPDTKVLHENKTSTNRNRWTQKAVDEHKQLDFYALMLALRYGVVPEDLRIVLNFIPVVEGQDMRYYLPNPVEVKSFETTRTSQQVADFAEELEQTVEAMEEEIHTRSLNDTP